MLNTLPGIYTSTRSGLQASMLEAGQTAPLRSQSLVICCPVNWIQLSEEAIQLEAVVNTIMDVEAAWNREIALPMNNWRVVRKLQRHRVVTLIAIHTQIKCMDAGLRVRVCM